MLLPRLAHFTQHLPKLFAQTVLVLQTSQVGDDLEADQALVVFVVAIAMRIRAHEAERACKYGFKAADVEFADVTALGVGLHGMSLPERVYLVKISLPSLVACNL